MRSLAISLLRLDGHTNIAAANRHHARDPQRTLRLQAAEAQRRQNHWRTQAAGNRC
jgi:hypothetical protein